MSVADAPDTTPLGNFPEFDLNCLFDDPDDPARVTVFAADDGSDIATSWITVDAASAVPLDEAR